MKGNVHTVLKYINISDILVHLCTCQVQKYRIRSKYGAAWWRLFVISTNVLQYLSTPSTHCILVFWYSGPGPQELLDLIFAAGRDKIVEVMYKYTEYGRCTHSSSMSGGVHVIRLAK